MSDAEDRARDREMQIQEAQHDLVTGHLEEAGQHLQQAQKLGASQRDIKRLKDALAEMTQAQRRRTKAAPWAGFGLCAVGYLILSIQQPDGWGVWVWRALALVGLPLFAGVLVGKMMGPDSHGQWRFHGAAKAGAWAMGLYAVITLLVLRSRIGSGPSSEQTVLIIGVVAVAYALVAGLVAGAAGRWLAYRTR